ncbi:MAG: retropepsin-like aspartic protease [Minisyncoccia bacterium]
MKERGYGYTGYARFGVADYTYRPLVDVEIASEKKSRKFKALVDSGTEITVMDQQIATLLGIEREGRSLVELSGIEAWKPGFIAPVSLKVDGFNDTFSFNVLFIEDLRRNFEIILGQDDFFRNFVVRFEKYKNKFYLQRAPQ